MGKANCVFGWDLTRHRGALWFWGGRMGEVDDYIQVETAFWEGKLLPKAESRCLGMLLRDIYDWWPRCFGEAVEKRVVALLQGSKISIFPIGLI